MGLEAATVVVGGDGKEGFGATDVEAAGVGGESGRGLGAVATTAEGDGEEGVGGTEAEAAGAAGESGFGPTATDASEFCNKGGEVFCPPAPAIFDDEGGLRNVGGAGGFGEAAGA
ncbi:MAG TPA: hypothetical protein VKJ47_22535 [Candidatus Binatia bacterium]|nr:hypothetical protein [Candidatus Binatia bacterium]